jgi:hypothetical protein
MITARGHPGDPIVTSVPEQAVLSHLVDAKP